MDDSTTGQGYRSEEELAWDEEFRNEGSGYGSADLRRLGRMAVRVPLALLEVPGAMVPSETRKHARAAAREGFLAMRSLLGAIGDNIEEMLAEPSSASSTATVQGPPGTWGTGRTSMDSATSSSKAWRISIDEEEGKEPTTMPGDMP
jgi:hypothetical protein